MMRRVLALGLLASLAACAAVQKLETVSDAQVAVDKVAVAVATVGSQAPLLAKVSDASCAGQALANVLNDMLTTSGHTIDASKAAALSTWLGYGCTWTLPVR